MRRAPWSADVQIYIESIPDVNRKRGERERQISREDWAEERRGREAKMWREREKQRGREAEREREVTREVMREGGHEDMREGTREGGHEGGHEGGRAVMRSRGRS